MFKGSTDTENCFCNKIMLGRSQYQLIKYIAELG